MAVLARDRFETVAPHIGDSGVCPEDESAIIAYLNLVVPMLLKRMDAKDTVMQWCMPAHEGCFSLPSDCLEVRNIFLDGFPLVQRDQWYEGKLTVGLDGVGGNCGWGRACNANAMVRTCGWMNVFDMGDGHAIPTPWPGCRGSKIGFMAQNQGDAGKTVTVLIKNQYNDERQHTIELLEDAQIVVVNEEVRDVKFLRKDRTLGFVIAYIINPNGTKERFCKYTPNTITASFHWHKLPPRQPCKCGMILIRGKARFFPIESPDDLLLIDDQQALIEGCRAINCQRREDPQGYNLHVGMAVNELDRQLADASSRATVGQASIISPFGRSLRTRVWT